MSQLILQTTFFVYPSRFARQRYPSMLTSTDLKVLETVSQETDRKVAIWCADG